MSSPGQSGRSGASKVGRGVLAAFVGIVLVLTSGLAGFAGGRFAQAGNPSKVVVEVPSQTGHTNLTKVVAAAAPSVVSIESGPRSGTGFVVSRDDGRKFVVTNAHVLDGLADEVTVRSVDGKSRTGRVLGRDPRADLAVVEAEGLEVKPLPLRRDTPEVGTAVVVIGNALDLGVTHTVTSGIVSAVGRDLTAPDGSRLRGLLQVDAAVNPGNSGGPVLDLSGRVLGVTTAKIDTLVASSVGFAIPTRVVLDLLGTLSEGARLGVVVTDDPEGTLVTQVVSGSAADLAGLEVGDVVVSIDGDLVTAPEDLISAVARRSPGDQVIIGVRREGRLVEVEVTLGKA